MFFTRFIKHSGKPKLSLSCLFIISAAKIKRIFERSVESFLLVTKI
uniref:Uncharacterized protein n=1 Tax=Myoviridae sp. ctU4n16 TaxID=2826658 RepID=A0A8S5N4G6_9CAUD|nr:MAG TPA: hypothetical protein [Myoviridae sp. ctU4n16]